MSSTLDEVQHTAHPKSDEPVNAEAGEADRGPGPSRGRQLSVSLSTAVTSLVVIALIAAVVVLAILYGGSRSQLSADQTAAADRAHAERTATNYAVGAATTDYKDLDAWFDRLRANTTQQLSTKFDATKAQLQQILVPLNWDSKATPVASVVSSENGGVYKVNAFVNVASTSKQAPDGVTTTVTYTITLDKNAGWKITDVGGLDGIMPK
ncbi:hypothetical protein AAFP35_25420 [Gordonia sp. CPCC 206044]|uniref:hypothetical protein n=1 Tax=Gordonia sp. CPCC 206044 TaxID=3140793 RepID=UPI003AF3F877